jgi:hypothetical protein
MMFLLDWQSRYAYIFKKYWVSRRRKEVNLFYRAQIARENSLWSHIEKALPPWLFALSAHLKSNPGALFYIILCMKAKELACTDIAIFSSPASFFPHLLFLRRSYERFRHFGSHIRVFLATSFLCSGGWPALSRCCERDKFPALCAAVSHIK